MKQKEKTENRKAFWSKLAQLITPMDVQARIDTHKLLDDALKETERRRQKPKSVQNKLETSARGVSSAAL